MKLSRRCEYAILALLYLARNHQEQLVTIRDLAENNNIPRKFLEQILASLKRQGFIKSTRGPKGGYKLANAPQNYSLAAIIRAIDGALAPVDSASEYFFAHTPIEQSQKVSSLLREIRDHIAVKLEKTTLADLL